MVFRKTHGSAAARLLLCFYSRITLAQILQFSLNSTSAYPSLYPWVYLPSPFQVFPARAGEGQNSDDYQTVLVYVTSCETYLQVRALVLSQLVLQGHLHSEMESTLAVARQAVDADAAHDWATAVSIALLARSGFLVSFLTPPSLITVRALHPGCHRVGVVRCHFGRLPKPGRARRHELTWAPHISISLAALHRHAAQRLVCCVFISHLFVSYSVQSCGIPRPLHPAPGLGAYSICLVAACLLGSSSRLVHRLLLSHVFSFHLCC